MTFKIEIDQARDNRYLKSDFSVYFGYNSVSKYTLNLNKRVYYLTL